MKKLYFALCSVLMSLSLWGQTYKDYIDAALRQVDLSAVTGASDMKDMRSGRYRTQTADTKSQATGILYDRVFPFALLHQANEKKPVCGAELFFQAWLELTNAAYVKTSLRKESDVRNQASFAASQNRLPIGLIDMDFQIIDPDAAEKGLLRVEGDKVIGVPDKDPFIQKNVILLSALAEDVIQGQPYVIDADRAYRMQNAQDPVTEAQLTAGGTNPDDHPPR